MAKTASPPQEPQVGYLGYAGGDNGIGVGDGVVNGLFGVGLDAYGNYSNFSNPGCPAYTPGCPPE